MPCILMQLQVSLVMNQMYYKIGTLTFVIYMLTVMNQNNCYNRRLLTCSLDAVTAMVCDE